MVYDVMVSGKPHRLELDGSPGECLELVEILGVPAGLNEPALNLMASVHVVRFGF